MRKKKFFGKRALLNIPGEQSTAAIVAEIEDSSTWKIGCGGTGSKLKSTWQAHPGSTFSISDCTRTIDLSVGVADEREYENSLYKIDTMVEALAGLRQGLVIERERYIERIKGLEDEDD